MKLRFISAHESDTVYIIKDTSPEFNLPVLGKDQIMVIGPNPSFLYQVTSDNVSSFFKDSNNYYTCYVNHITLSGEFAESGEFSPLSYIDEVNGLRDTVINNIAQYLSDKTTIRDKDGKHEEVFGPHYNGKITKNCIDTDDFLDIYLAYPSGYYIKSEMDDLIFTKITEINNKIYNLSSFLMSTYFSEGQLPFLKDNTALNEVNLPEIKNFFDMLEKPIINDIGIDFSILKPFEDKIKKLQDDIDDLQKLRNLESYANIKFKAWDPVLQEFITIDTVYINGYARNVNVDGDGLTYRIRQLVPNTYTIRIEKKGYLPVWITLQSQIAESISDVDVFNLGNVIMVPEYAQLKFIFTWGEIPDDLDTHVYSFDENGVQREHAFFNQLNSEESKIEIDHDDVDQFGPETTQIFVPKDNYYYLLTIHNYSLHYYKTEEHAHMNFGGLTNVRAQLYNWYIDVKPTGDNTSYWWDVLVLYNGHIYVIDDYPTDRETYFSYDLTKKNCSEIIRKVRNCDKIYNIKDFFYTPTEIRFY